MVSLYVRISPKNNGTGTKAYCVQYKDSASKRKVKQFKLRKEAVKFLTSLEKHNEENLKGLPISCEEVIEKWLLSCKLGRDGKYPLEPETIKIYKSMAYTHIIPYFKDKIWSEITKEDCKAFRDHLIKNTKSRSTAKSINTTFKVCMAFSLEESLILTNPSSGVTVTIGGRHKKPDILLPDKSDIKLLSDTAVILKETWPRVWDRYCPMFFISVYCGLRVSELLGLPRENIDITNSSIYIDQRADKSGIIGPPKSKNAYRTIYFPAIMSGMISDYLRKHNHELAFPTKNGKPILQANYRKKMWMSLQKRAGLSQVYSLHSLRHFYASIMIARGCNVKELCNAMGHHDEGFTLKTYGHLFEDEESIRNRKLMANAIVL